MKCQTLRIEIRPLQSLIWNSAETSYLSESSCFDFHTSQQDFSPRLRHDHLFWIDRLKFCNPLQGIALLVLTLKHKMSPRYPPERLEHALRLFRDRPAPQPLQPTKYDFRKERVDPNKYPLDHYFKPYESESDGDDDYDPEQDAGRRRRRARPNVVKKPKESTSTEQSTPKPRDSTTLPEDPIALPSCVTLKLKSDRGRNLLRELAEVHGKGRGFFPPILPPPINNPLDRSNLEIDGYNREEATQYQAINQYYASKSKEDIEKESGVRRLRSRKVDKTLPPPKPASLKPAQPKSIMAKPAHSKPPTCTNCEAQNKKCDLRSVKDRSCIHCIATGSVCVVEGAPVRSPKNDQLAGHPTSQTPAIKTVGHMLEAVPPPSGPSRVSSIESSNHLPARRMPASDTTQENSLVNNVAARDKNVGRQGQSMFAASSALQGPRPAQTPRGIATITTYWCHPVDYNFQVRTDPLKPNYVAVPCHFCHDFRYSVFGCGQRTIEVTRNHDKHTYTEVNRTYIDKTRICLKHALMYIRQSKCQHKVKPLAGVPGIPSLQPREWKASMTNHSEDRVLQLKYPCCSLCPTPAVYGCPSPISVKYTLRGVEVKVPEQNCKYFLCEECKNATRKAGASQSQLVAQIRARGITPRADIDFLFPNSDLHKVYGVAE